MPRNIDLRKKFVENAKKQKQMKPSSPKKPPKKPVGSKELFGDRSIRMGIAIGGIDLVHIIIRYKKATTGQIKKYVVAPYSYRWRRTKKGRRQKCLYAYDPAEKTIKSFYIRNIKGIEATLKPYRPRWEVEIGS